MKNFMDEDNLKIRKENLEIYTIMFLGIDYRIIYFRLFFGIFFYLME